MAVMALPMSTKWVVLLVTPVLLLVCFCLLVPYQEAQFFINRKTGDTVALHSTYRLFTKRVVTRAYSRGRVLHGSMPMTAPDRKILARTVRIRFPWSDQVVETHETGNDLANAYQSLFCFDMASKYPDSFFDHIIAEHVEIWNSEALDHDTAAIIQRLKKEGQGRADFFNKNNIKISDY